VIFQTLDDKKECIGLYYNNKLVFDDTLPDNLTGTWSYSAFLKDRNINYAQLYVNGKTLEESCPEHIKDQFLSSSKKIKSLINACMQSKVSLSENCFFDLAPKKFLIDYCDIKNKICNHIFDNYEKPKEYNFYKRFNELLHDIKYRKLNIDLQNMQNLLYKENANVFYKKLCNDINRINYNLFGSVTGRLTVKKDSFPILTFPKQFRNVLKPNNDWFVSFDMNAAEIRMALALAGKQQPIGDFHQWSVSEIYGNKLTRAQAKETTTSWLYNSNSPLALLYDKQLSSIFDKNLLKNKYWINGIVYTPYDRKLEADEHHAISYLNQSSFIDLFHRQIIKVDDFLTNKKSYVAFMIHDEFVLDMTDDEKDEILEIIKILEDTPYGKFPVNIKAGKTFGEMKKINLKAQ